MARSRINASLLSISHTHIHTILGVNLELDAANPLKSSLTFYFHLIPSLPTLRLAFIRLRHCISSATCNESRGVGWWRSDGWR